MKNKIFKTQKCIILVWLCVFSFHTAFLSLAAAKQDNPIQKEKEGVAEYTLGKEDVIDIAVRRHSEFSGKFKLGSDGKIQYPFIGDIDLKGLTKAEAEKKISGIISEYIESPEVDITIAEFNSKVVYVFGLVAHPGKYKMQGEYMPVREAILAAGLPREDIAALRRAVIIRPQEGEDPIVKKVNLLSLLYEGNLNLNYDLKSGDIVYVPSTVMYKVSTVMEQVLGPAYRGAVIYNTVDDINNNNN